MGEGIWLVGTDTALLVDTHTGGVPIVRAWGHAPARRDGDATGALRAGTPAWVTDGVDPRVDLDLLPRGATGYFGTPSLSGAFLDGTGWALDATAGVTRVDGSVLRTRVDDPVSELRCQVRIEIDRYDVVRLQATVTNRRGLDAAHPDDPLTLPAASAGLGRGRRDITPDHFRLDALRLTLPVPDRACEVVDVQGRWIREYHLQRHHWQVGAIERSNRRGRTSFQDPPLLLAGDAGFSHESGQVWAIHLGWSGNSVMRAERTADGFAFLQAAEFLHPGEVTLAPGETYRTPVVYAAASTRGTNGISDAFHGHVRARAGHPRRPRPITLNTWEAVYFDHDQARLSELVDLAADLGVERFVLDDGWFTERDDDAAGLGDWVVDPAKHGDGLATLGDHVRDRGMEFGVWVEPEMVNPESELHRRDATVAMARPQAPLFRNQHVLDVARDDVHRHLRTRLDDTVTGAGAAYLKWDCNRDLVTAEFDGVAATHAHVEATYRLVDALRADHPDLEIESCASGGARIDLGILARTDRVWASDTNDPVERQRIQHGISLLLPPELVGCHVGPPAAHTTRRRTSLPFRLATAFFGHLGFEWDVTAASDSDRARLREAIALHARWRPLLHTGRTVRVDHPDPGALVHAVIEDPDVDTDQSLDGLAAVACHAKLETSAWARPAAVRIPGLDPGRRYRVQTVDCLTDEPAHMGQAPGWYADGIVEVEGAWLAHHGVMIHHHDPATATVLAVHRA